MYFGKDVRIRGDTVTFLMDPTNGPMFIVETDGNDYIARVRLKQDGDYIDFEEREDVPLLCFYSGKRYASDLLDSNVPDTAEFSWGMEGTRIDTVRVDTKDLLLIGRLEKQLDDEGILRRAV